MGLFSKNLKLKGHEVDNVGACPDPLHEGHGAGGSAPGCPVSWDPPRFSGMGSQPPLTGPGKVLPFSGVACSQWLVDKREQKSDLSLQGEKTLRCHYQELSMGQGSGQHPDEALSLLSSFSPPALLSRLWQVPPQCSPSISHLHQDPISGSRKPNLREIHWEDYVQTR